MKELSACGCYNCVSARKETRLGFPLESTYMIVCETCGNKRCPHGTDHHNQCTNSNAPGQVGSRYPKT